MSSTDHEYDRTLLESVAPHQELEEGEDNRRRTRQFYDADLLRDPAGREGVGMPMQQAELGGTFAPPLPMRNPWDEKFPVEDNLKTTRQHWYKTRSGIIAIIVLILVIIGAVIGGAIGGTQGKSGSKKVGNSTSDEAPVSSDSISNTTKIDEVTNISGTTVPATATLNDIPTASTVTSTPVTDIGDASNTSAEANTGTTGHMHRSPPWASPGASTSSVTDVDTSTDTTTGTFDPGSSTMSDGSSFSPESTL